jgi:deoxyribose-phosphate aldolase
MLRGRSWRPRYSAGADQPTYQRDMKRSVRIAVGADHGGFELKQQLVAYLQSEGHQIQDCGTSSTEAVDYPAFAEAVARTVASGQSDVGIMIDGAGIGSAMTANKVPGIRAAACYNEALAGNSREHNDANVLTLGSGQTTFEQARGIVDVFLTTLCTAKRHRNRVEMIGAIERKALMAGATGGHVDLSPEDLQRIADRVRQLMEQGQPAKDAAPPIASATLARMIDHTLLKPEATKADVEKLCDEARRFGFCSVCVNPTYVRQAKALLRGTQVKVCCVVGFPLGAQPPESKALESRRAIREGATEIDMVINIGALKSREDALVLRDIRAVVESCKDGRALCKVIFETALLTDDEKVRACELSMKAGADFVKTSTGFSSGGATVDDVRLMAKTVAPKKLGVKAAGGIRTYDDAVRMIQAGATRIGASASVKIVEDAQARESRKG